MRTNVVFLSSPNALKLFYGSTFLRGQQLSELLAARLSDRYSVLFTTDSAQADSIIVLTKGWLAGASAQAFADLKARGNILLADPVDLGMRSADLVTLAAAVDGFIASSKRQMAALTAQFADKPCHLVTHNIDRRLPSFAPPADKLRLAYVGLTQNCRHLAEVSRHAEIVETPSAQTGDSWTSRLPLYNCHYALRQPGAPLGFKSFLVGLFGRPHDAVAFRPSKTGLFDRPHDFVVFKPFTKGFTAAHCLSPILTDREDDALFYLPDDYPFFLPDGAWDAVSESIRRVRDEFGGPSWRYALDIMRAMRSNSSADHIANEFKSMLAYYR